MIKSFLLLLGILSVCYCDPLFGREQASELLVPDELVLAIHPYLPAVELHKRFTPLVHYLEKQTGKPIRIEISANYETHIQKVGEDRIDFAYLGPAPYVTMSEKYDRKTLLAGLEINGSPFFHGVIIVTGDSPIASLADLVGKKIAFTAPNSTMGYLVPKKMLEQAGITKDKLALTSFLGSHNNVAMAVLGGYFDAGAVKEEVYTAFQGRGIRVLAKTAPFPEHLFIANPKLSPQLVETLSVSLLGLKDTAGGLEILKSIKKSSTAFVTVQDSDFDLMRELLSSSAEGANR